MLISALLIVVLVAAAADTPVRRAIAAWAARLRRPRAIRGWILLVAGLLLGAALLAKVEGLALGGPMLAEGLAWATAFDIAAYVDAIAVMAIIAATVRMRMVWPVLRSAIRRMIRLLRSVRRRGAHRATRPRRPRPNKPRADDAPPWGFIRTCRRRSRRFTRLRPGLILRSRLRFAAA